MELTMYDGDKCVAGLGVMDYFDNLEKEDIITRIIGGVLILSRASTAEEIQEAMSDLLYCWDCIEYIGKQYIIDRLKEEGFTFKRE